jgi:hypothetical protein
VGGGCKTGAAGGGGDKRGEEDRPDAGEEDFDAGVDGDEAPCTEPDRDAETPIGEEGAGDRLRRLIGDRLGRLPNQSCSSS